VLSADALPARALAVGAVRERGSVTLDDVTLFDLSRDQLAERLSGWGEPAYRARQVHDGIWKRGATYEEMTDLPAALRSRLAEEIPLGVDVVEERTADGGSTRKALLRLGGRHLVEVVLMGYPERVTACVSSQSGCAMGCGFCATGQMGLWNNLTAGEIAAQAWWARREASALPSSTPRRLTNVVFMGMGEPLANERHTFGALERLTEPNGFGLGDRHITVSTVGVVPAIARLAERFPQVGLAVSLHAADDALRDTLVPVNRLWPLAELERAVIAWREATHRRPSIEWAMIAETNDDDDQARKLGAIAQHLGAHVNLIPLNPTPGWPSRPSPPGRIAAFASVLRRAGVNVTVRDTRGREIDAACGQLRSEHDRAAAAPSLA
jgi:23S rRNA (adenine2503-C2)-methyltransferase